MASSSGLLDSRITLNVERFFLEERESLCRGTHLTDIRGIVSDGFQYLKSLSHVNVCSYVDILRSEDNGYTLVSEGYSLTLGDVLRNIEKSNWESNHPYGSLELVGVINQIISGLQYLHSSGIAHGALTLENIFITPDGYIKIWGYARPYLKSLVSQKSASPVGINEVPISQLFYTPPEAIIDCKLEESYKADVWSLGICILVIMGTILHIPSSLPVTGSADFVDVSEEQATELKNSFIISSSLLYICGSASSGEFRGAISAIGLNVAKTVNKMFSADVMEVISRSVAHSPLYTSNFFDWITGKRLFDKLRAEHLNGHTEHLNEHDENLYILGICYDCLTIDPLKRPSLLEIALRYKMVKNAIPQSMAPTFSWSISGKNVDYICDFSDHEMCRRKYVMCSNTSEYLNFNVGIDDIFYYWKLVGNDPQNLVESLQVSPLSCLVDEEGRIEKGPFSGLEIAKGEYSVSRLGLHELFTHMKIANLFPTVLEHQLRPSCGYARQHSFIYQWLRINRFRRLLASLNREQIIAEAKIDIPPLLRKFVWCAILEIDYKEEDAVMESPLTAQVEKAAMFYSNDLLRSKKSILEIASAIEHLETKYAKLTDCFYSFCIPLFLLYHNVPNVFRKVLETIFCRYLKDFYVPSGSFVGTCLAEFTTLLNFFDPKVASHLRSIGAYSDSYALSWFMTLFAENLSVHQLYLVLDAVLLQPRSFVKYLAVAAIHSMREKLLTLTSSNAFTSFIACVMETLNIPMLINLATNLYNRWHKILMLGKDETSAQALERGTFTFILEEFPVERCFRLSLNTFSSVLTDCIVVDLRPIESYKYGSIPNSIHVSVLLDSISPDKPTGQNVKLGKALNELRDKTNELRDRTLWLHKDTNYIIIVAGDGHDLEEETLHVQRLVLEFHIRHLCYYRINAEEWPRVLTLAQI